MRSAKLPAFSGYTRPGRLSAAAGRLAEKAQPLARYRPLSPTATVRAIDTAMARLLGLLLLVLLGYAVSCKASQSAAHPHRDEHPAPVHGHYEWHWADE